MPIISSIPKPYKRGFELLASQKEETFTAIQGALEAASLSSSTKKLAAKIIESNDLDEEEVERIFTSVGGLISFLEEEEDIDEVVEDIIFLGEKELIQSEQVDAFRSRLQYLLKNKKIFYASKVEDLVTESENLFLTCRIVSDIRPIFGINVEESPEVGMIIHNLHIHYRGKMTAQHQDIYLSLDSNDVAFLIETLIRADKKDEILKGLLTKMGLNSLND